jgi:hypothetical protein
MSYSFRIGVAGMEPLIKSKIDIKKVVRSGEGSFELKDTDLKISFRELSDEEIKEWIETLPPFVNGRPQPQYKSVMIGKVDAGILECKDQSHYVMRYGDKAVEDVGKNEGDHSHPKPHRKPFHFSINIKGCSKPDPNSRSHGPPIFVRAFRVAALNESYSFKFKVAGMRPLQKSVIHLKKVVKGKNPTELVDTDFEVSLRRLSDEEIKEWMDRKDKKNPRPAFKHAIIGKVKTDRVVTCGDQGPYMVIYGDKKREDDYDLEEVGHLHPKPHRRPRGFFFILVKGCEPPRRYY